MREVEVFGRRGTDPATTFLHRLIEKHDLSDTIFLVDSYGYPSSAFRLGSSSSLDYIIRNLIEKCFHTFQMRIDRFNNSWGG